MSQPAEPTAPPVTVYGDGTPVVLLHAFPLDSRMWVPQVEALGGYQAIVPDLRGFGAAREQAGEITPMDLLAEDVAKLLDERELERVVICGLSMGGYVALAFAGRHPERLGGLVLCDTGAGADTDDARAARLAMAERVLAEAWASCRRRWCSACSARPPASSGRSWSNRSPRRSVTRIRAASPPPSAAWPSAPTPPGCSGRSACPRW